MVSHEIQNRAVGFDIAQIEMRVESLRADLNYLKDILASKASYESKLYGVREQKKFDFNSDPESQAALNNGEKALLKGLENATMLADKMREKILRALGKL